MLRPQPYRVIVKFADELKYFEDPRHYVASPLDSPGIEAEHLRQSAIDPTPNHEEIQDASADNKYAQPGYPARVKQPENCHVDHRKWRNDRLSGWAQLVGKYPWLRSGTDRITSAIQPLFTGVSPEKIIELINRAERTDPHYGGLRESNLLTYFAIECPDDFEQADAERFICDLSHWNVQNGTNTSKVLEVVYIDRLTRLPSPPYFDSEPQEYLDVNSGGINVQALWDFKIGEVAKGGNGAGQHFIDLELAWAKHSDPDKESDVLDIPMLDDQPVPTFDPNNVNDPITQASWHGLEVLGIVCAQNNGKGIVGIAHGLESAKAKTVSYQLQGANENRPDAILRAIKWLPFGGVLLLEAQVEVEGHPETLLPVESLPLDYEIIRLGTALGVIVIEAAGNSGKQFPSISHPLFGCSGAIMVGAATFKDKIYAKYSSNYGCRIDCFAPGKKIQTTTMRLEPENGALVQKYYGKMNGTSPASAIIAGVVLGIQGIFQQYGGFRIDARTMRKLLVAGGQAASPDDIGRMPDLDVITKNIKELLSPSEQPPAVAALSLAELNKVAVSPAFDLYLKDDEDDKGDPFKPLGQNSGDNSPSIMISYKDVAIDSAAPSLKKGDFYGIKMKVWNRGKTASPNAVGGFYIWRPSINEENPYFKKIQFTVGAGIGSNIVINATEPEPGATETSSINYYVDPDDFGSKGVCYLIAVILNTGDETDYLSISAQTVEEMLSTITDEDKLGTIIKKHNKLAWRKIVIDPPPTPPFA